MSYGRPKRGQRLETAVRESAGYLKVVCVVKTNPGFIIGKGNRAIATDGLSDFVGCVEKSGRGIYFDCKECGEKAGFPIFDKLKAHQERFISRMGNAGAVAGLLVECTDPGIAAYFWLDWRDITRIWYGGRGGLGRSTVPWDRMIRLGDNKKLVDFTRIPGVQKPEERVA